MIKISNFIQNRFNEGDNFYDHLISLFKENNSQKEETSDHQYQLKSVKDVFEIMNRNCLSLDRFRKITERLLQNWYINVFSEPVLVSIGYTKSYRKDDLGESQTNSFELSNELGNNDTSGKFFYFFFMKKMKFEFRTRLVVLFYIFLPFYSS
jgi:hypothetical protein